MQFTFLRDGKTAFFRDDAEEASWTQEELSLTATFPFRAEKQIERGMVVLFEDLDGWQAFEIRTATVIMGDSYQQITAESIAISELTDCHIPDDVELTDLTAAQALAQALEGTGWSIGTDQSSGVSSGDFTRGSAWQAVSAVKSNWNVYITPRVTVGASGITGRFLDITLPGGTWRGLRLTIDRNISDATVTYDDTELATALYAYGGSVDTGDQTAEVNITGIEWIKTKDHPAKPLGQAYLEDPEKTALYGRNGKPRFGYYQNTDIEDPNVLIEKTWESLKQRSEPRVSITGTVTDMKRLGYNGVPVRLHDLAVVEIVPGNIILYREVIQNTVNLLDPTGTTPTIGDYIANIIYINRKTYEQATGETGGASGGGGRGSKKDAEDSEFRTTIARNSRNIDINAEHIGENGEILSKAGLWIDPITGVLIYADDNENMIGSKMKVQSDMIRLEVAERKEMGTNLSSEIRMQKDKISLVVKETGEGYEVNSASIVAGINDQHGSYIKLRADTIDLRGYVTASQLHAVDARIDNLISGRTLAGSIRANQLAASSSFSLAGHAHNNSTITIEGVNYHIVTWT
ncbi:MAG: phage tail protein [Lentisphaeria bacterium]|nr:phage tail protein [Lentisphaeria bacterium]